ncbi:hypothetical protein [Roseateles saccharophilus]|uniref:hypothetical protein n=1 Tax=Roseateles saccharophilus TaxID=304 RepID=UPI001044960A|nr:hypothetical protein [Roseateles saccharophilus]MBL8277962.1 hypothetical protein [Roseateles sp.]MDG0833125.1 hypothetical protein [Roseateles saccharophilus]
MKRVRIAPGKFVAISPDLAEKAERVLATGLTREQVAELRATEPKRFIGAMAGSPKPLAIAKPRANVLAKAAAASPASEISASGAQRRKSG